MLQRKKATVVTLPFGAIHKWTDEENENCRPIFCLPGQEGSPVWATFLRQHTQRPIYAFEYDERLGSETMESLVNALATAIQKILSTNKYETFLWLDTP